MNGKYCYSWDNEDYCGEFDTEKEAIEEAASGRPEADHVYIGVYSKEYPVTWNNCHEEIINSIKDDLYYKFGDLAERFEVSDGDILALDESIDETVTAWIKERGIRTNLYKVLDGHKVNLA